MQRWALLGGASAADGAPGALYYEEAYPEVIYQAPGNEGLEGIHSPYDDAEDTYPADIGDTDPETEY